MKARRTAAALGALVLATTGAGIVAPGPAFAVPPGNDSVGGAIAAPLGFSGNLDTSQATTDADDAELNSICGAPATDASVWYTVTPDETGGIVVDVSGSDYSAGVIVATGSPGNWSFQTCGPGTVGFTAQSGTTYTILAFDDQLDGSGTGGTLAISVAGAPPAPSIDVTVDKFAAFDAKTGVATVTGTATCAGAADFAGLDVELSQKVGRVATVQGWGFADIGCTGAAEKWSAQIRPQSGKFAGGKAASVTFAYACGPFECAESYTEHIVQLRGKK